MNENTLKIAILVDGDNAQAKLLKSIIDEVTKYGKVTIRRIYGDWTENKMNCWKAVVNETSFTPMQKFEYTTGKNSTDGALIIDAMDILHSKTVSGFCIVSSDSDYTGLAKRIREEGLFVMGVGEKKTPNAFVKSCEIFTYCENIDPIAVENTLSGTDTIPVKAQMNNVNGLSKSKKTTTQNITNDNIKPTLSKDTIELIDKAYELAIGDNTEIHLAKLGTMLRSLDSTFDPRSHGFSSLLLLFKSLKNYEVIENIVGGLNHPLLRKK